MLNVNRICLLGNIGSDIQVGQTSHGKTVANMTMMTQKFFVTNDGQKSERTEWHRIVAWGKLAEVVQIQLRKGSLAYIEGELAYRDWVDKRGQKQRTAEVVAAIVMAGGPQAGKRPKYAEPAALPVPIDD